MYSVVLMAALSASTADAPGFHKRSFGCTGGMYLHSGGYGSCIGCLGWGQGCYGNGYGGHGYVSAGCYGCMGCYGSYAPYMQPAGNPMQAPPAAPPAGTTPPPAGTPPGGAPKAAQLIIEKPADATIFVDDRPVKSDGTMQSFATPVLDPSQAYFYMIRVDLTRDGKSMSETRRVVVWAGQTINESFREPTISTAKVAGR